MFNRSTLKINGIVSSAVINSMLHDRDMQELLLKINKGVPTTGAS